MKKQYAIVKKLVSGALVAAASLVMVAVAAQGVAGDAGTVSGEASARVAQALKLAAVQVDGGRNSQVAINEAGTFFQVNTGIVAGDHFALQLGINNLSTASAKARLVVTAPELFKVAVAIYPGSADITGIQQVDAFTWEITFQPSGSAGPADALDLTIGVGTPVTMGNGSGEMTVAITPVGGSTS